MAPNWDEINRCPIWKVLGVAECDNCDTCVRCWGEESILPEVSDDEGMIRKLLEVKDVK